MTTTAYGSRIIRLAASNGEPAVGASVTACITGEPADDLTLSVHLHELQNGFAAAAVAGNQITGVACPAEIEVAWRIDNGTIHAAISGLPATVEFSAELAGFDYLLNMVLRDNTGTLLHAYGIPLGGPALPTAIIDASDLVVRICAPNIVPRDAVGNFCRGLAATLSAAGFATQLYADVFSSAESGAIRKSSEVFSDLRPHDILLINHSIYDPFLEQLLAVANRKICYFHNVTPSALLEPWDSVEAQGCALAERQIYLLARCDGLVTQSQFTADYLNGTFEQPLPISLAPPVFRVPRPRPATDAPRSGAKLLFVGRLAPHKRIDDILRIYGSLLATDADAGLTLVGSSGPPRYMAYLQSVCASLQLGPLEQYLCGSVTDSELQALYGSASAYICMSAHEGYCVPVLEAMESGLPVVCAFQPAISELLGGSGMEFQTRDPATIARGISRVLHDDDFRAAVVASQYARAAQVAERAQGKIILEMVSDLAHPPVPG